MLRQPLVSDLLEEVISETREQLLETRSLVSRPELTKTIATRLNARLKECLRPSLTRVINASGVVLHTNLGRAPLPRAAVEHLRDVCISYSNLEFNLTDGSRGSRDIHCERLVRQLLGCEAAIVVNNNAAAVFLVLNTLAENGEVIASRGEQVEIGGSFRIPEVMEKSRARLREVGTTNRTRIDDYERAINESTRLLLRVHPSNFRMIGFTERPSLEQFIDLGRTRKIPTFEDLGSGCISSLHALGIRDEPLPAESIKAGVDVISFSGDKLLGGPQAGIIAGKKVYVGKIRRNPLYRALRVDKLTISILEWVLLCHVRGSYDEIPVLGMLRSSENELQRRTDAFARRAGSLARPVQLSSVVGGGSAPETYLPSWGVAVQISGCSPVDLEKRLRNSQPPVIVRIDGDRVVLDFRTVSPSEEEELLGILKQF